MSKLYAVLSGVAVVALLGGTLGYIQMQRANDKFAECRSSVVAGGGGDIGGPFTLVDETGKTVTDKDVLTKPSLVYFGYTFCPDVCPLDNARNAEAIDLLTAKGYEVAPVFISIDPERDTPEILRDFTDNLHEKMIGLTGTPEQVQAASRAYKTYYKKQDTGDQYYLMDHSTFTYLMLPGSGFADFFNRDDTPEQMADRVACFINKS
ncbi:MAG: Protein SenC [Rhodobacteraceae bacterium]|uniref:SCO family protein n=1 Tax=Cypionkella sp. TaxID=2811411 RepID=UPI001326C1C8|nr:SCO family protein [Cypionkella sp.]KAF0175784.1 MAG: Protein SenC [Paracoccaceae bacterium]MDO8326445.1 SCO family protein [Cypionkella sp.]